MLFSVASTHKSSCPGFEIVPIELFRAASHTESTQFEHLDKFITASYVYCSIPIPEPPLQ